MLTKGKENDNMRVKGEDERLRKRILPGQANDYLVNHPAGAFGSA
jgi:hypothetical protein